MPEPQDWFAQQSSQAGEDWFSAQMQPEPQKADPSTFSGSDFLSGVGQGVYDNTIGAVMHPIDTLTGMARVAGVMGPVEQIRSLADVGQGMYQGIQENPSKAAGNLVGTIGTAYLTGKAVPKVPGALAKAGGLLESAGVKAGANPATTRAAAGMVMGGPKGAIAAAATPPAMRGAGAALRAMGRLLTPSEPPARPTGTSTSMRPEVTGPASWDQWRIPATDRPMVPEAATTGTGAPTEMRGGASWGDWKVAAPDTPSPVETTLRQALAERMGQSPEMPKPAAATNEVAQQLRQALTEAAVRFRGELGSRDAARALGLTRDQFKKLAPSESRLPDRAQRAIDAKLETLNPQQKLEYLAAAKNDLARNYIKSKLGLE